MPPTNPRISQNVSDEIARLEAEIAALELRINKYPGRSRGPRHSANIQSEIAGRQERLRILKNPGADDPHITPAPMRGPMFSAGDPVFSGVNLDIGRVGVDALKLIRYPSQVQ